MAKKLCKKDVEKPGRKEKRFFCENCGNRSNKEKKLCDPKKI
jgi:hypothetical protein